MIAFRRNRIWFAATLVCALTGVVGCSAQSASGNAAEPTEEAAQPLAQNDVAPAAHPGHPGHPGPDFLLKAALHELGDLTPAQKTAIEAALPTKEARRGTPPEMAALAAGVRAGTIDTTAVQAASTAVNPDRATREAAIASAVDTLHSTLTQAQRRTLVDSVNARIDSHSTAGTSDDAPRAHEGNHGGPLGHLLGGLNLTAAQSASVDAALAANRPTAQDHEAMKANLTSFRSAMRARLETFVPDSFDAKAFTAPPAGMPAMGPQQHAAHMAKDLAAILPILEPAQRESLASALEKGPSAPPSAGSLDLASPTAE